MKCPICDGNGETIYEDGCHTHSMICDNCNGTGVVEG